MKNMFKRFMDNFKKDERGLTLVELLAVVVILAIVGLIAFVSIGNVIENSRKDAHVANAQQIISAAELYEASGGDISKIDGYSEGIKATALDTVNAADLIDPWDNDLTGEKYDFTISVSGDGPERVYEITDNKADKCGFGTKTKTQLAQNGRDACEGVGVTPSS